MNIQIFGTKKSFDSKKAERFFKERGIKYQFVDMKEKGLSKGEFNSVCQAVGGYEKLIDQECKDKDLLALITYLAEEDKAEKILENQKVIKTPIVRNGKQATVGYQSDIPEKYKWQAGTHGSAWKYCCSLIGAAPTPYYKAGEALMNHDYDKVLKNRIHDKSVPVRDTYQQLKTAQKKKDEVVQYKLGDAVTHPKFGHGIVEKINQRSGGVHLHIRFDGEVKCIDQKWLSRKKYM